MQVAGRVVLLVGVLTLIPSDSDAFKFVFHIDITDDALGAVYRNLPPDVQKLLQTAATVPVTSFTSAAMKQIADANEAKDTGDCSPNKDSEDAPAQPCTKFGSDSLAAFNYLSEEPAADHFDNETIQVSSDQIFDSRDTIRKYLKQGRFAAARKVLGGSLHALQDFYAHSNYVQVGRSNYEPRLGASKNSFSVGTPRLARANEPLCLNGQYLITELTADQKTALLSRFLEAAAAGQTTTVTYQALMNVLNDRPLTSGYFFFPTNADTAWAIPFKFLLPNSGDIDQITDLGKCRHGWQTPGPNAVTIVQPGINKDDTTRENIGYSDARRLATIHTIEFVREVMTDPMINSDPNYALYIMGLMGHETGRSIIQSITLGVPGAPNGDSWDTAVGSVVGLFTRGVQGLKNIQPDVLICVESPHVPGTCANVCEDADWHQDDVPIPAYMCSQPIGPEGVLYEHDLHVLVREVDFGEPRRVIASFRVDDPTKCTPLCALDLEPGRTVWLKFEFGLVPKYNWRYRATPANLPQNVPLAVPASGGGTSSSSGSVGSPAAALASGYSTPSSSSVPASTSSATAPSPTSTGTSPTALSARTAPPAPAPTTALARPSPTGGAASTPAPVPRSPAAIDASLGLRDQDNCVGNDMFFPQNPSTTVGGPQLYQAAAFATTIPDATVKTNVFNAIRSKVGDDAFYTVMSGLATSVQQSQALVAAFSNTTGYVAQRIVSQGLDKLLSPPVPSTSIPPAVGSWILKKLATPPLVSTAVDMMFAGSKPLTAECTLNELAKEGFTDTVYGR